MSDSDFEDSPPAPKRQVRKSVIIERLSDVQLAAALALLTPRQIELRNQQKSHKRNCQRLELLRKNL